MKKPHLEDQSKPFFITEEVGGELIAAGYEFAPLGSAWTTGIRELFGWQPGEARSGAVSWHLEKSGAGSGREPRGEGV